MNFRRLDFKNAYAPIPTVDDICKTLSVESADIVKRLEDSLAGMKIKTKIKPLRGGSSRILSGRWNMPIALPYIL